MSKYNRWFGNFDYESGYSESSSGSGKRKRDDYSYGGNSNSGYSANNEYSSNSGLSSHYGGVTSYSTTSGVGSYNSRQSSGCYDNFLTSQNTSMNEMSKRFHKMEMMKQIANLEREEDEEEMRLRQRLDNLKQLKQIRGTQSSGGGFGANYDDYGYGGRPSLMGGRHGSDYVDHSMSGSGNRKAFGNGGGGGRRGGRMGRSGGDWKSLGRGSSSGGVSGRHRERKRNTVAGRNYNGPKRIDGPRKPIDIKGRDTRLKQLMKSIKTCKNRIDESTTFYACHRISKSTVDVYYCQKYAALYLDGLYFGRGLEKPYKQLAFKEAIYKMRNLTLNKIKEEAAAMGKLSEMPKEKEGLRPPQEEMKRLTSPLEFSELPFVKRMELFAEEIKKYDHITSCLKIYSTKYLINLKCVYHYLAEKEIDKHEYRVYANEVYLTSARGHLRKRVEFDALKNVYRLFRTKSIEEIMEHDGRFSQDYEEYPLFVTYRGVGYQEESNAFPLRFFMKVQDINSLKDRDPDDIIILEKNVWQGAWFRILEESASVSKMVLKWTWNVEQPADEESVGEDSTKVEKEESTEKVNTFDIDEKRREIVKQAKQDKCNVIHCKATLQGREIGEGYGLTRNQATRMAALTAYKQMMDTQTAVFHTLEDKVHSKKEYTWPELRKRAKEMQDKQPDPPIFEDMRFVEIFGEEFIVDRQEDEVVSSTEAEEAEPKLKEGANKYDEEKEDELAAWVKEVVRKDMEDLYDMDPLAGGGVMYHDVPMYVRDVAGYYCGNYNVAHKSRFEHHQLISLGISKQTPDVYELVNKLNEMEDKKSNGYTLEQIREPDGTVVKFKKHDKKEMRRHYFERKPRSIN